VTAAEDSSSADADGDGVGLDTGVPHPVSVSSTVVARTRRPITRANVTDRTTSLADVKWKLLAVAGAAAGAAYWANRRKRRQVEADAALWADATDPVARFGG
jgi:hypothetical protein